MTYVAKDVSVEDASPVMLVQFAQSTTIWRYTTIGESIVRSSQTWYPEAIEIGKIAITGEIPKDSLTIKLPYNNAVADTFVGGSPDLVTTVTVFRTHYDDTEVLCAWKGRVDSATTNGSILTLNCEPIFSSLRRLGIRPCYQKTCRYALFGRGCNVDPDDYEEAGTVTAITGNVLTITEGSELTDLTGGTLTAPDGTTRMILAHSGDSITIMRPIKSLIAALIAAPAGVAVTLFPGCDHNMEDCRETYNALGNYGGHPIPRVNPMSQKITLLEGLL